MNSTRVHEMARICGICSSDRVLNWVRLGSTVVSGRLNVVRGLKQTNQMVTFERTRHIIGLQANPVRIYLARDHSIEGVLTLRWSWVFKTNWVI
jgi:hypothetical protein